MSILIAISHHARRRQAQRNISDDDIDFMIAYGQRHYCAGAVHVFLGRRNLPHERELYQRYARLEGTILVLRNCGSYLMLITIYRNRRGLKSIRAKAPYDRGTDARSTKNYHSDRHHWCDKEALCFI